MTTPDQRNSHPHEAGEASVWHEISLPAGVLAVKSASRDIGDIEVALKQGLDSTFMRTIEAGVTHEATFGDTFGIETPDGLTEDHVRPMTDKLDAIRTQHLHPKTAILFIAHRVER